MFQRTEIKLQTYPNLYALQSNNVTILYHHVLVTLAFKVNLDI